MQHIFVVVFQIFCFSVNNTPRTHKGQTDRCVVAPFHCLRYRRLRPSKALQTFFTLLVTVCQLSLRFFKLFYFSVNNTPCTHEGQTVRCVLATFHCLKYGRLRPSKALQTFFTSQLIVGNIVVGQKPRYSTPTSSISFILGLEILYFKILPSLSQETTSMSRKIRNWWETVV